MQKELRSLSMKKGQLKKMMKTDEEQHNDNGLVRFKPIF